LRKNKIYETRIANVGKFIFRKARMRPWRDVLNDVKMDGTPVHRKITPNFLNLIHSVYHSGILRNHLELELVMISAIFCERILESDGFHQIWCPSDRELRNLDLRPKKTNDSLSIRTSDLFKLGDSLIM